MVERQMRNWEFSHQQRAEADRPVPETVHSFVTVSRTAGSGGKDAAVALADRINWPVFDSEVLVHMAGDNEVRKRLYGSLDERDVGFIQESVRAFFVGDIDRNDYFRRLTETILALARKSNAVFVGRGADLILPRDKGLRVRFTALPAVCAQRYAAKHGIDPLKAARDVERLEHERSAFIRQRFGVDPAGPDRFDLVLNISSLSRDEVLDTIAALLRRRGMID